MTDLEKRVAEWASSPEGKRILAATLERAKRAAQYVEDAARIDPDDKNRPMTI